MTTFSADLTNPGTTYQRPNVHLSPPTCSWYTGRQHRSSSDWRHSIRILVTDASRSASILAPPPLGLQKHTDLRANDFAHSPLVTRQGSLTVGMPEAGDFVESFEPYTCTSSCLTYRGTNAGIHRLGGQMCPRLWALWRHEKKNLPLPGIEPWQFVAWSQNWVNRPPRL
jgi:hypothetical protein